LEGDPLINLAATKVVSRQWNRLVR
jgi:hypothetical protein